MDGQAFYCRVSQSKNLYAILQHMHIIILYPFQTNYLFQYDLLTSVSLSRTDGSCDVLYWSYPAELVVRNANAREFVRLSPSNHSSLVNDTLWIGERLEEYVRNLILSETHRPIQQE